MIVIYVAARSNLPVPIPEQVAIALPHAQRVQRGASPFGLWGFCVYIPFAKG